jgi:hypothetical protein
MAVRNSYGEPCHGPGIVTAMRNATRQVPARLLNPDERDYVAEWLAASGDVSATYVSNRRGEDPALCQRIIIVTGRDGPSHLVHAPADRSAWIVISLGRTPGVGRFPTLRAALHSIRPILAEVEPVGFFGKLNVV